MPLGVDNLADSRYAICEGRKDLGMGERGNKYRTYPGYRWVVCHPDLLGGRPTVRGTRISVSQVLECLSIGMTAQEIANDYPGFPAESVPEVLRFAAAHVAA